MPFKKGSKKPAGSGRKKGQTNKATADIKQIAQSYGAEAIGKLVELMRDADFETVQVAAAKELLDRGYGKSVQPIEGDVVQTIRYEVRLAFGQSAAQSLHGDAGVPARISGPARNGKALGHNGSAS